MKEWELYNMILPLPLQVGNVRICLVETYLKDFQKWIIHIHNVTWIASHEGKHEKKKAGITSQALLLHHQ